jgi:putative DNA methylase
MERRFIESVNFPFSVISEASAVEKGPGRPPHWEMVFWWTRKPLISARAIIAGCLLPEKTSVGEFLYGIGIRRKGKRADGRIVFDGAPHRVRPRYRFEGVRLLDPFAGFGSIPLEGLRLGLDVTAVELLPVAYVFLKAVLEYPAKYGERLVQDVEKWGRWVTERLREDPLIRELYEDDVAVYIGSWEVKCPHCGRWTPLVGNWWLARVKAGEGYARLTWMEPVVEGGEVKIKVVDLNKALGDRAVEGARVSGLRVTAGGKEFRVPESNIEARREKAVCLLCHQPIMQIDPQTGRHYAETKGLPKEVKERLKGYVKFALELYNKGMGYGTNTELPPWISEVPARQRLLVKVKVKQGDLEFEPCTEKDQEKLEKAKEEVKRLLETNDPDVPREPISLYSVRYLFPILYGMTEWYKLFNPRQLLTLVKLVKLIREAGEQIEQEKIKEGLSKEEAFKYAEAVTTYFAIAFARYASYSTLMNPWKNYTGFGSTQALMRAVNIMVFRGIAMTWNWCDYNIVYPTGFLRDIISLLNSLDYLNGAIGKTIAVRVFLDDATVLGRVDGGADLIVTDPPYYDDVPYAELSDFYYVWLKRALSDVENGRLVPRFMSEAFFEKVGDSWIEVSTQWEKYAISEVSLNPPRLGASAKPEDGVRHFQNLLNASFVTMASKLENNGLLVTYYAHTDPNAWKALLEAGWEAAGFSVTNAFPITTESAQSVVKRGKLSMDTSIVVVWRKGSEGAIEASELYNLMVEESANRARELMDIGAIGRDLVIGTLAASLAVATKYREIKVMGKIDTKTLIDNYVYPATYLGLAKALAIKAELKEGVKHPDAMFYLLVKSILPGAKKKTLESTDLRIFSIGTSLDLNTAIKTWRILKGEAELGAKVAKAKTYTLIEPPSDERSKIAEILEVRGINPENPQIRCAIDALHTLEYYAVTYSREEFKRKTEELKNEYPSHVEEALTLAKILAKTLPKEDPEWSLCKRITDHLSPEQKLLFPEKGD